MPKVGTVKSAGQNAKCHLYICCCMGTSLYNKKKMEMKVYLFYIQKMLCMAQYFTWKMFVTFKASLYCIGYFKNAKNWGLRTTSAVNRASWTDVMKSFRDCSYGAPSWVLPGKSHTVFFTNYTFYQSLYLKKAENSQNLRTSSEYTRDWAKNVCFGCCTKSWK